MRPAAVRTVHRFLALMTVGAFLAAAALFGMGVAKADGVLNATETQYVAHYGEFVVCASIDGTPTPTTVLAVLRAVMKDGFTEDDATDVINASVLAYCDWRWPLLERTGRMVRGEQRA